MAKRWYRQKTTWAGIAAVIGSAGGYLTGELGIAAALQTAVTGLMGIFLRQAVNQ